MKKTYLILIALIAVSIGAIMSTYGDASTYENFGVAAQNTGKEYHVVGTLCRDKQKTYEPTKDPNFFSFFMKDDQGKECRVVYHNPEPQDFDRSEKIVIVGSMDGDHFEASKILLKCPSKYTDNQVKT